MIRFQSKPSPADLGYWAIHPPCNPPIAHPCPHRTWRASSPPLRRSGAPWWSASTRWRQTTANSGSRCSPAARLRGLVRRAAAPCKALAPASARRCTVGLCLWKLPKRHKHLDLSARQHQLQHTRFTRHRHPSRQAAAASDRCSELAADLAALRASAQQREGALAQVRGAASPHLSHTPWSSPIFGRPVQCQHIFWLSE
jgi:hypothetical protein